MELPANIWLFFGMVIVISLSGVMTPGPLFAAAVEKGYKDSKAGIKIALGHGLVEFPLMVLIAFSAEEIFTDPTVKLIIGVVGGVLLVFFGAKMVSTRKQIGDERKEQLPRSTVLTGAMTTAANPYFLLWWATIGLVLITGAMEYGPIVVVVFAIVHWSCDLAWYAFTSYAVFKTKHLWTPRIHEIVFGVCGALMIAFGVYFVVGPAIEMNS